MDEEKKVFIIIPAYNPDEKLLEIINDLEKNNYQKIVIVNDGSRDEKIFDEIPGNIDVITHAKNCGKGTALKDAIKFILNKKEIDSCFGIITVDADGQHTIKGVNDVYYKMKGTNNIVFGSRKFNLRNVPIKSKIGNNIMTFIVWLKTKKYVSDTQTGLRGYPKRFLAETISLPGERFEYEQNVLMYLLKKKIEIEEVTIETIYNDKNKKSNFKPIRDSIYCIKCAIKKQKWYIWREKSDVKRKNFEPKKYWCLGKNKGNLKIKIKSKSKKRAINFN